MRLGSLFTGYGGLDMAAVAHYDAEIVWYAEVDDHASNLLAHHHPGIPNLGDVTAVDWTTVPTVDVLTGGYPCQPFSRRRAAARADRRAASLAPRRRSGSRPTTLAGRAGERGRT